MTVLRRGPGWLSIRDSIISSFRKELAGSTYKRAGGVSSDAMRWLGRVLRTLMRSSKPPVWPPSNSTDELTPRFGVDRPRIIAATVGSFLTVFKERSTRGCTRRPGEAVGGNTPGRESVKQEREIKKKEAESE